MNVKTSCLNRLSTLNHGLGGFGVILEVWNFRPPKPHGIIAAYGVKFSVSLLSFPLQILLPNTPTPFLKKIVGNQFGRNFGFVISTIHKASFGRLILTRILFSSLNFQYIFI